MDKETQEQLLLSLLASQRHEANRRAKARKASIRSYLQTPVVAILAGLLIIGLAYLLS